MEKRTFSLGEWASPNLLHAAINHDQITEKSRALTFPPLLRILQALMLITVISRSLETD